MRLRDLFILRNALTLNWENNFLVALIFFGCRILRSTGILFLYLAMLRYGKGEH